MKARLIYYAKLTLEDRYVVETSIHAVDDPLRYPHGIKYGFICKDIKTGFFVLMDNHHPKGPHVHINEQELSYLYRSDEQLKRDFEDLVFQQLGVIL